MKIEMFTNLNFIFLIYSFLGFLIEVSISSIKSKQYINRGMLNGPFCISYGFLSIILFVTLRNVESFVFGIFVSFFSGILVSFLTAKILFKISNRYWWDFSKKKFNYDGIISLDYSIIIGIVGYILTKFVSPFLIFLFNDFSLNGRITFIILCDIVLIIDFISSLYFILRNKNKKKFKDLIGRNISELTIERINLSYPNFKNKVFDKNTISFYKLFLIFYITGIIGCFVEVIFCRFSMGYWMHRSSLIFEEISIVWGGAFLLCTILLHRHRDANPIFIFLVGTLMGAFFEYICSGFTEYFFGTVFWSYGKHRFNLNKRINLAYSVIWGLSSLLYIKYLFPLFNKLIDKIPEKIGKIVVTIIIILFSIDCIITSSAYLRYQDRRKGDYAQNYIEEKIDYYFNDEFIKSRFKNIIVRD